MKLTDDLKKAIVRMPTGEKDKLLLRLVAKDEKLVAQLQFQLLEGGATKDSRREEVRDDIDQHLVGHKKNYYYSPGYLLLLMRDLSGTITRHVAATKDKYGEIELNFFLLNRSFELFAEEIKKATPQKALTFNEYVVKRALKLLTLLGKLHEDHVLDFQEDMKRLGRYIGDSPTTMKVAINHVLDVNWLLKGVVPR